MRATSTKATSATVSNRGAFQVWLASQDSIGIQALQKKLLFPRMATKGELTIFCLAQKIIAGERHSGTEVSRPGVAGLCIMHLDGGHLHFSPAI